MPRLPQLLLTILLLAIIAYGAVGYVIYDRLSHIGDICADNAANGPGYFECHQDCAGWLGFDFGSYRMPRYEEVQFKSRDGLILSGWYVETDPAAPVVIVVHGYQVCKYHHDPLSVAGALSHVGYNVLLFDQRDCGDSEFEDGRTAYGSEEYLDALGAFDYLLERGFAADRIGMHGSSLGGAVALIAFAHEPRLQALFLDSPLIDGRTQFAEYTGLPALLFPGVEWAARLISDDDLTRYDPLDGVRCAEDRALFAVHGTGDSIVRSSHTLRLAQFAADAGVDLQVWMPQDIGHVRALPAYPAQYEAHLQDYFGQNLRWHPRSLDHQNRPTDHADPTHSQETDRIHAGLLPHQG